MNFFSSLIVSAARSGISRTVGYQCISCQNARASGVGNYDNTFPLRDWLPRQQRCHIEQFLSRIDAHDSGLLEQGIDSNVQAGQSACVRRSAFAPAWCGPISPPHRLDP